MHSHRFVVDKTLISKNVEFHLKFDCCSHFHSEIVLRLENDTLKFISWFIISKEYDFKKNYHGNQTEN